MLEESTPHRVSMLVREPPVGHCPMRVLRLFPVIPLFLWSLAGECTIFVGCLTVMCDSQDLTLQAILSNGSLLSGRPLP